MSDSIEPQESHPEKVSPDSTAELVPLEGGRQAWFTITGAWMVQFCTFGYINAFGVYQDYYTRDFLTNRSAADISWIGSFQLCTQYAFGALIGRAFDAGYFHHMMIIGSTLYVLSIFMVSLARPGHFYQVFLAQAVGMGIGQAMIFLPSFTIVSHHFKRRRALAIGIVTSGAACGGVVFPIMLNQLGQHTQFATGIRATASLVALQLLLANFMMKTRQAPKQQQSDQPPTDWKGIFTDVGYLASLAGAFFTSLGLFFPFFYLQLYAVTVGVDKQLAFYLLTILNAGSVIGRLVTNAVSRQAGAFNLLVPCLFLCSILIFTILGIKSFAGLVIFAVLYGFTSGAYASLMPSILVSFSTHAGEYGIRLGIAFSIVASAMLVGNPISGALIGTTGHFAWGPAVIFNGVLVSVGGTFVLISRFLFIKRKGTGQLV